MLIVLVSVGTCSECQSCQADNPSGAQLLHSKMLACLQGTLHIMILHLLLQSFLYLFLCLHGHTVA